MAENNKTKKKIKSRVKYVKQMQQKHPVSEKEYRRRLAIARRKDFTKRFLTVFLIIVAILAVLIIAVSVVFQKKVGKSIFAVKSEAEKVVRDSKVSDFKLTTPSKIYSSDGTKIATVSSEGEEGTYLSYDKIPKNVVNAFIAVEDQSFWKNNGTDSKGIARVLIRYITSGGSVSAGASTITQQLTKLTYLSSEKTIARKVKEIFIARGLAEKYSKKQIMEFYVNNCYFGNGAYGISDASTMYFRKNVSKLSVSQIAYLCAIPNRPEHYNPYKYPNNIITRRNKILKDMMEEGYISKSDYEVAIKETIRVKRKITTNNSKVYDYETTYAINCATRYLMKKDGFEFNTNYSSVSEYQSYQKAYAAAYTKARRKLARGGYKVKTTIDLQKQKQLQDVLDSRLSFNTLKNNKTGAYRFQGALTAIDNDTHKVVAIVGGRSQSKSTTTYSLNRAYQSYRQPGSTFKPIAVYTPSLEKGYTRYSSVKNVDVSVAKRMKSISSIVDMSGSYMTMQQALTKSVNGCAYWLFAKITPSYGLSYIKKMNFSRVVPTDATFSAALGGLTYGVSTLEMANAYSTLENDGEYTEADCIDSISDNSGTNIYTAPSSVSVYSKTASQTITQMMKSVITSGTASSMGWYGSSSTEAAGKTGTTNGGKDGWFCGYTPYYTVAVWVGYDTPQELSSLYGGTYPAHIWKSAMLQLIDGKETKSFSSTPRYEDEASKYRSSRRSNNQGTTTTTPNTGTQNNGTQNNGTGNANGTQNNRTGTTNGTQNNGTGTANGTTPRTGTNTRPNTTRPNRTTTNRTGNR